MKSKHDHSSFAKCCPACGLAPRQVQPLVAWGYEFLTTTLAPCVCGASLVQIEGGIPKTFRVYCASTCGMDSGEHKTLAESVLEWNRLQIAKGFDSRKLHSLNR